MSDAAVQTDKPVRLYKQSYLQLINNSVGSTMFRNFYVSTQADGTFDALNDGQDACAFYVSAVLTLFGMIKGVHGTVDGTVRELDDKPAWLTVPVDTMQAGDVLVWAPNGNDAAQRHIGFYIGDGLAVSNVTSKRRIARHEVLFEGLNRPVDQVVRFTDWP